MTDHRLASARSKATLSDSRKEQPPVGSDMPTSDPTTLAEQARALSNSIMETVNGPPQFECQWLSLLGKAAGLLDTLATHILTLEKNHSTPVKSCLCPPSEGCNVCDYGATGI